MKILGLDLGTSCGWAMRHDPKRMDSGVWSLQPKRHDGPGMRWVRFRAHLSDLLTTSRPDLVAYEEVRRHLGTDAAHCYGGFQAVLQEECERAKIPITSIPVGTVKKLATGKGNASKVDMMGAASSKWGRPFRDDNEADARWIAEAAACELEPVRTLVGGGK